MMSTELQTGSKANNGRAGWRKVASSFSDHGEALDSAVSRVLRTLLAKIDAGDYAPGQKINTVELASDLQISRAPIREALHILAGKGIVSLLPDRGAILRPFSNARLSQTLVALNALMQAPYRVAAEKIDEGRNRVTIESHRNRIMAAVNESTDFHFWLTIHDFLHDIARIGGNEVVEELILSLNLDLHARVFEASIPLRDHIGRYEDTFRRMADALLAGDGETAVTIGNFHTRWQISLLERLDR